MPHLNCIRIATLLCLMTLCLQSFAQESVAADASQGQSGKQGKGGNKGSGSGKSASPGSQLSTSLAGTGLQGMVGTYRLYAARKSQSFYSLGYKGSTLFTRGNAFTGTSIADSDPIYFGSEPIFLNLNGGKTSVGGTIVQNLNTLNLPFIRVKDPFLRLLIGFDAQTEKQTQQHLLFGIEYRPSLTTAGAPVAKGGASSGPKSGGDQERFIGFGFATEKHNDSANGINKTVPSFVFRGRIGLGSGFVTSKSRVASARQSAETALGQLSQEKQKLENLKSQPVARGEMLEDPMAGFEVTRSNARSLAGRFGMNPPIEGGPVARGEGGPERASLADVANELDSAPTSKGGESVTEMAATISKQITLLNRLETIYKSFLGLKEKEAAGSLFRNQPRISLYSEFDGSYALDNHSPYKRYRNIWSANLRLDLDPSNENLGFIMLRYENGFCRAEPNRRANALTVTFGFSFP